MMTRRVFGRLLSLGGMLGFTKGIKALPAVKDESSLSFADKDGLLFRVHAEDREFEIYVNGRVKGFRGESVGVHNLFFRRAGEYHNLWDGETSKEDLRRRLQTKETVIAEYERDNGIEWAEMMCGARYIYSGVAGELLMCDPRPSGGAYQVKRPKDARWEDLAPPLRNILEETNHDNAVLQYERGTPCGAKFRYRVGANISCPKCGMIQVRAGVTQGTLC